MSGATTASRYLMRILPYRTTDNVIDGLVLTFVDITTLKLLLHEQGRLLDALRGSPRACSVRTKARVTVGQRVVFVAPGRIRA